MQKFIAVLVLSALVAFSVKAQKATPIDWLSWEEAQVKMAEEPKLIFIDVYTDWCGWCKRMDKSTFLDAAVAEVVNEHFYAVKFNAEQREDINYQGHTLKYQSQGRRGVHELAYALLDGRLSYPAFVYLDENQARISISPGYKDAAMMTRELRYIGERHYKTTKFEDFTGK